MNSAFSINMKKPLALTAFFLMLCSAGARIAAYWGFWQGGYDPLTLWALIALPLSCNLLCALFMWLFGRTELGLTLIPIWLGCAFFIIKAASFAWWHQVLCTLLYLLVGNLYALTMLGNIKDTIYLKLVFALPLAFHICQDIFLIILDGFVLFDFLTELSVLFVMASLLCTAFVIERRRK